jgi:hypothetical protein
LAQTVKFSPLTVPVLLESNGLPLVVVDLAFLVLASLAKVPLLLERLRALLSHWQWVPQAKSSPLTLLAPLA